MSVNVEWVGAKFGLWPLLITPADFRDEESGFFDEDGGTEDQYGIVLDSGGHHTLVYGTLHDLRDVAARIAALTSSSIPDCGEDYMAGSICSLPEGHEGWHETRCEHGSDLNLGNCPRCPNDDD